MANFDFFITAKKGLKRKKFKLACLLFVNAYKRISNLNEYIQHLALPNVFQK